MPTICELKIALKEKGIKGITGLNKSGLERLLSGGKTEAKPEMYKPKPFTPAPTKGESPKVAEKPITKKIKAPKMLRLTYKEPKEEPKKERTEKEPKKERTEKDVKKTLKKLKDIFGTDGVGITIANCKEFMCKYNIYSKDDFRKWLLKNHPDKGDTIDDDELKALIACAGKNKFCKKEK